MEIIRIELGHSFFYSPSCACIGNFDGMHRGHQELFRKTTALAEKYGCTAAMFTFDPDPSALFKGNDDYVHLSPIERRAEIAAGFGIKRVYVLSFTKEMAALSPGDFMKKILENCHLKALVYGFDFRFGANGSGDVEWLKQNAVFEVCVVPEITLYGEKISSSSIIREIKSGNIKKANEFLGYTYELKGEVIYGRQKGRTIGFPTANIACPPHSVFPEIGVYAGTVTVDDKVYRAMINLGHNPTFNYTAKMSLEAYLLDFSGDLYGRTVRVSFAAFLRPEKKYNGPEELKHQLETDVEAVRNCAEIII